MKKKREEKPIRVCPILAEVCLSFGRVFQYWPFLKKSISFNKNVKTNTHNILFVQKSSQAPPRSRLLEPGVFKTKLLHPFHSFLVSSFCLPALSPIFHSKTLPTMPLFSAILLYLSVSQLFCIIIVLLSRSPRPDIPVLVDCT